MNLAAEQTAASQPVERAVASPVVAVSTLDLLRWLGDGQEGQTTGPPSAAEPAARQCSLQQAAGQVWGAPADSWPPFGWRAAPAVSPAVTAVPVMAAGAAVGSSRLSAGGIATATSNTQQRKQGPGRAKQAPQQAATAGRLAAPIQPPQSPTSSSEMCPPSSPPYVTSVVLHNRTCTSANGLLQCCVRRSAVPAMQYRPTMCYDLCRRLVLTHHR